MKIAATITKRIGQQASAKPSSTASMAYCVSILQTPIPAASEITKAMTHAFHGDILIIARASTNHNIGDSASKNINELSPPSINIFLIG